MRNLYKLVSLETVTISTVEFFKGWDVESYYINKLTDPDDPEHIKFKFEKVSTGECFYISNVLNYSRVISNECLFVTVETLNSTCRFVSTTQNI